MFNRLRAKSNTSSQDASSNQDVDARAAPRELEIEVDPENLEGYESVFEHGPGSDVDGPLQLHVEDAKDAVAHMPSANAPVGLRRGGVSGIDEDQMGDSIEINTQTLEEFALEFHTVQAMREAWEGLCSSAGSRQAAGDAIYTAILEGVPSLQPLFKMPRILLAARFVQTFDLFFQTLDQPAQLKMHVETLGIVHLALNIDLGRVKLVNSAIIALFELELGSGFLPLARIGVGSLLKYVGGALVFAQSHYATHLKILADSWELCQGAKAKANRESTGHAAAGSMEKAKAEAHLDMSDGSKGANGDADKHITGNNIIQHMPTTFTEMFKFNAAIMGFGRDLWMNEVLDSFDNIVRNAADFRRMEQEVDLLVLRISKVQPQGGVRLNEFKSCMLAALRSMLPKTWDTSHEFAWAWLWENMERLLTKTIGCPPKWSTAVGRISVLFDEDQLYDLRKSIFSQFFIAAPRGQDFFKQSDTRLHFIIDKVLDFVTNIFHDPIRITDDISALGLRHVGYGVPPVLFGPFVTAAVEVMAKYTQDPAITEAFMWSLSLVASLLVRTINEGSTAVMKAITEKSEDKFWKAAECAPRGMRATWVLHIQVGTQSISPLYWAIDSGALQVARAIMSDLLTIRADRDRYYFGVDEMFDRHHDIVNRLVRDAPTLLPGMLDGLIWRARNASAGKRRVNYYVKRLVQNNDESFAPALAWLVDSRDPRIIAHEVVVLVSDTLWSGLVMKQFIYSKIWFVFSLFAFMSSQAILPRSDRKDDKAVRITILVGRLVTYLFTMIRLSLQHARETWGCIKARDFVKIGRFPIMPGYLKDSYDMSSFLLMVLLYLILAHEPILWCFQEPDFPLQSCDAAGGVTYRYSLFCMCAMIIHWMLLVDLAVVNTALSAFVLVVGQVLSEMAKFCYAFAFLLAMFCTSVTVLEHNYAEMKDIGNALVALFAITLQLYEDDYRTMQDIDEVVLLIAVLAFVLLSAILLLNLLVAQLGCSYEYIYQDSVGYARLRRAQVICDTIEGLKQQQWLKYLQTLDLDKPMEFNEGDVGFAGGMQLLEEASLHPVTVDAIYRFGGSCSPDLPWPLDESKVDIEKDKRFDSMEATIQDVIRRRSTSRQPTWQSHASKVEGSGSKIEDDGNSGTEDDPEDTRPDWAEEAEIDEDAKGSLRGGLGVDNEIDVKSFDELNMDRTLVKNVQEAWSSFLSACGTREDAGEAIYNAIYESSPAMSAMFTTPLGMMSIRFVNSFNSMVMALDDPKELKALVGTVGFNHLNLDVTIPRVESIRSAVLDLLQIELGEKFTDEGYAGWMQLLNYIGGSIMYLRTNYADRLKVLSESWAACNARSGDDENKDRAEEAEAGDATKAKSQGESKDDKERKENVQNIPTTFKGMFQFNAAVMGFSANTSWMNEVLACFDSLVVHVANGARFQQEIDLLCLKISKGMRGNIKAVHLSEYKACMLAALRSLLPKVWSTHHEVAWAWLWENVERLLEDSMQKPATWEASITRLIEGFSDEVQFEIRKDIYVKFFAAAPRGQDYFKQSDTRLHFIADRAINMCRELFMDPWNVTEEISALGLRHVGYDVPTELFGPFVTASVAVIRENTNDATALEAYRWSLTLISKILVRVIKEGSTQVMMAISKNSTKAFKQAINLVPRSERASRCLVVQVGTQSISPLSWAIESGSFGAAKAIIDDLLTFRADRDQYYYGVDELFTNQPDIIYRIVQEAPSLLPGLLDGLVWRSRETHDGMRRVNYYVKHLVQNGSGGVSRTLEWIAAAKDPKIISHPVIVLVSDTIWSNVVSRQFIYSQVWFILSLVVFMMSQAILPKLDIASPDKRYIRFMILIGRVNTYIFTMGRLFCVHAAKFATAYKQGDTSSTAVPRVKVPAYLRSWYHGSSFTLLVLFVAMFAQEPMLWCLGDESWPTDLCAGKEALVRRYCSITFGAMVIHWGLLMDLSVFNTGLSAFALVVAQVMSEITRFIFAMVFLLLTFGSAISVLEHDYEDMRNIPSTMLALFSITLRLYEHDYRNMRQHPALLSAVFTFMTATSIMLLNLLTAQLNCSYEFIYQASVGFARLNKAEVIVEALKQCPSAKWTRFLRSLSFDQPLEFNEGDVGIAGGIQVEEPAFLNPVTQDQILRFGGSCAPEMPWPQEEQKGDLEGDEERFDRMERNVMKVMKRLGKMRTARKRHGTLVGTAIQRQNLSRLDDDDNESVASSESLAA